MLISKEAFKYHTEAECFIVEMNQMKLNEGLKKEDKNAL